MIEFKGCAIINKKSDNLEFKTPYNFVNHLNNGLTIDEALSKSDVLWNFNEFKRYYIKVYNKIFFNFCYDSWTIKFYRITASVLLKENHAVVIEYLKNGLTIKQILNKKDRVGYFFSIKNWYNKGFHGDVNHILFYKEASPLLISQNQANIIRHLKNGFKLHEVFEQDDVITNMDEFKKWYNEGYKGVESYVGFYKEVSSILKPKLIKKLINHVEKLGDLHDAFYSLNIPCTMDEIKDWYLESNGEDLNLKLLYEINTQEEVVNLMKNKILSFEDVLKEYDFNHTPEEIKEWYNLGLNGNNNFVDFYKGVKEISDKNGVAFTKKKVIELVKEKGSLEEVLENYSFDFSSEEIKKWYDLGDYHMLHTNFRNSIDLILGNKKRIIRNAGGYIKR